MSKIVTTQLPTWRRPFGKLGKKLDPFTRPLMLLVGLTVVLGSLIDGTPTIAFGGKAAQPEYRLDLLDRVRLRVFEWRPALDEVFEWKALNDEYSVGPNGEISVPLLGQIPVSGKTLTQVSDEVGDMIRTRIGIAAVPKISVEIVRYRPFYITGQVQKPGEYDFRPQLTVLQAVSLAGGINRNAAEQDAGKDLISFRGELNLLNRKYVSLLARRARFVSTLNGADKIKFPKELVERQYQTGQVLDHESALFRADKAGFKADLVNLETRKDYLTEAVQSLQQQLDNQDAERTLAREELSKVERLVSRKLTVEPRRLAAQKNVYQLEGLRLRLQGELLNARQRMEEVEAEMAKLRNEHSNKSIAGLRDTQAEIDEVLERMNTLDVLYSNAATLAPAAAMAFNTESIEAKYEIVRTSGGYSKVIAVDESAQIKPGDTVKVKLVRPEENAMKPMAGLFPRDIPQPDLIAPASQDDAGGRYYSAEPERVSPAVDGRQAQRTKPLHRGKSALEIIFERDPTRGIAEEVPSSSWPALQSRPGNPDMRPSKPENFDKEAKQERAIGKGAMLGTSIVPLPVRRPASPVEEAMIFPERSPMHVAQF